MSGASTKVAITENTKIIEDFENLNYGSIHEQGDEIVFTVSETESSKYEVADYPAYEGAPENVNNGNKVLKYTSSNNSEKIELLGQFEGVSGDVVVKYDMMIPKYYGGTSSFNVGQGTYNSSRAGYTSDTLNKRHIATYGSGEPAGGSASTDVEIKTNTWYTYTAVIHTQNQAENTVDYYVNDICVAYNIPARNHFSEMTTLWMSLHKDVQEFYFDNFIIYNNMGPVATNPSVGGELTGCGEAVAVYDFYDPDNDLDASAFAWYAADTPDGEFTLIAGAGKKEITLTKELEGKYLMVEITPRDNFGKATAAITGYSGTPVSPGEYSITFVEFTNTETAVTAFCKIYNNTSKPKPVWAVLAVYTSEGALLEISTVRLNLPADKSANDIDLSAVVDGGGYSGKLMIYSDIFLSPIIPSVDF